MSMPPAGSWRRTTTATWTDLRRRGPPGTPLPRRPDSRRPPRCALVEGRRAMAPDGPPGAGGSDACLGGDAAGRDGPDQGVVIALVLVRVRLGEVGHRLGEGRTSTEVGGHRDPVAGPGMGPSERPPTQPSVRQQALGPHGLHLDGSLPVAQLTDVEVARRAVDPW